MRSIVLLSPFLIGLPAFAQITIGPADMPSAGDTMAFHTATSIGLDPEITGTNHTWNASDLLPMGDEEQIAVPVNATPLLYQFYFNNPILYPDHNADFAIAGTDLDVQLLSITDTYDYFKNDASGYRNVGFGAMVNGLPASVRRIPVDRIHVFPLQFGDVDSSFSAWETTVPGMFSFFQEQWRYNEVDGWGTLILPADTFEVLRVRSVLARHDSIFVDQFGMGFGFDEPGTIEYRWIAAGMDRPVLMITSIAGTPTLIEYFQEADISTSIEEAHENAIMIWPNPVHSTLNFNGHLHEGNFSIHDAQGRLLIEGRTAGKGSIDVSALPPGIYSVAIENSRPLRFVVAR